MASSLVSNRLNTLFVREFKSSRLVLGKFPSLLVKSHVGLVFV